MWRKFRSWPMWAQVTSWVVLAIVVLAALAPSDDDQRNVLTTDPSTTIASQPTAEAPSTTEAPPTTATPTTAPPTTPPTTAAPQWVEVATLSGSNEKQGDTFELQGGKVRLRYQFAAGDFGIFTVYVIDEGDSLDESGGFPEITCSESCSDETLLRKSGGAYYLDVKASGGEWSIVVEEER